MGSDGSSFLLVIARGVWGVSRSWLKVSPALDWTAGGLDLAIYVVIGGGTPTSCLHVEGYSPGTEIDKEGGRFCETV